VNEYLLASPSNGFNEWDEIYIAREEVAHVEPRNGDRVLKHSHGEGHVHGFGFFDKELRVEEILPLLRLLISLWDYSRLQPKITEPYFEFVEESVVPRGRSAVVRSVRSRHHFLGPEDLRSGFDKDHPVIRLTYVSKPVETRRVGVNSAPRIQRPKKMGLAVDVHIRSVAHSTNIYVLATGRNPNAMVFLGRPF